MNKWVIWAIVGLVILGVVIGGYYFLQNQSGSPQNKIAGETKTADIPGEILNGMFDALERGLNKNE